MEQWNKVPMLENGEYYWIVIPACNLVEPVIAHYEDGEFAYTDLDGSGDKAGIHDVSHFKHIEKPADKEWLEGNGDK